jgi:hypothetical protein
MPRDAAAELLADLGFVALRDHPGAGANSGRPGSGKQTCGTGRSSGCANYSSQTSGTDHTGGCGGQAGSASCCDNQTGKRNHHSCTGYTGYNGGTSGTGGNAESACADDCSGGQVSTVRCHRTSRRQTG